MKSVKKMRSLALQLALCGISILPVAAVFADGPLDSSVPTSQPSQSEMPARSAQEIMADYQANAKQLATVLPMKTLSDPAKRNDAAPQAIPIIFHRLQLIDELGASKKVPAGSIAMLKQNCQAMLFLLNDTPTVTKVKEMETSGDPARKTQGESIELAARWMGVGSDKAEANKVATAVEKLDRANPADSRLTMMTISMAQSAPSPELSSKMISLVIDVMTDPYANRVKGQLAAQKKHQDETQAKQSAMMNKPFTVAAKTIEGKDFTSADWKGKVVLVDFWATWCGPCKAGLPHVKEVYNQYHDKGLEIVGVSNDYSAKALQDFTPANGMPWPQLFDADAAEKQQWNPLSLNNGVTGIPCMFLIDKKGVLRSVTARAEMDDLIPKLLAE